MPKRKRTAEAPKQEQNDVLPQVHSPHFPPPPAQTLTRSCRNDTTGSARTQTRSLTMP